MKASAVVDTTKLDTLINTYAGKPGCLLSVLEEAQKLNEHNYLSESTLRYIAHKLNVPPSNIYSIVTFYAFFNLKPQGEHTIVICRGTACHTRGSRDLLETLKLMFDFDEDDLADTGKVFLTTKDKKFTIKTVACFGQCALAPVIEVDGVAYGNMTINRMKKIIAGSAKAKTKKK